MSIELDELGITQEQLADLVVTRICDRILTRVAPDEDGEDCVLTSSLKRKLDTELQARIDTAVVALADTHVLPNVATHIERLTLQETNKWGEKRSGPLTFIEYLVSRAEAYMLEEVNYEGKVRREDSFSFRGAQTRLTHMIDHHLHYSIKRAMEAAVSEVNSSISKGLEATVKMKLVEIQKQLRVTVKTK